MTNITTTCRDISELLPAAQTACRLLFQEHFKAGIKNVFITETYRSQERQKYLYAQGRTRPGQIVDSNHKSRLAWDIAVGPPQNLYDVATLRRVGAIARKLGITRGGDWTGNIDRPHFEVKPNWIMPKEYKIEGQVIIPTNSKYQVQLTVEGNTTKAIAKEMIKCYSLMTQQKLQFVITLNNQLIKRKLISHGLINSTKVR
ncbi:M15 family metallopeptidase [Lysinibacillus sphaericus]|uniref:M15 family metallopeptidase n=1 Tax=Lysinibacillus sphaericus TaxID=1421 RepID=UPI001ECCB984|nr:M15 family metallopeptidase [Lysinibacillus sphaericus]MBG9756591.1 hypothetical protein [Lysinibacillus sphaericus]